MTINYCSIIKSVRYFHARGIDDIQEIEQAIIRLPKGHNWGSVYIDSVFKSSNSYAKCIVCDYILMYNGFKWILQDNPKKMISSCKTRLMDEALG